MGNHKSKEKKKAWAEALEEKLLPHGLSEEPVSLSLIIPVYNCSEVIGATLKSVESQDYTPLEIIIIDAGSRDRTLEVVNSYASHISRIYTVTTFKIPDMLNRGISLATGRYVSFLFPGSDYIAESTYHMFAQIARQHDFPDVMYCGSIQRELKRAPRTVQFSFDIQRLREGKPLATLPACWFQRELFHRIGKFDTRLHLRPDYEFFCRLAQEHVHVEHIDRIYVDFAYGRFSYGRVLRFAAETWRILFTHFGLKSALIWFFSLNHFSLFARAWRQMSHR